MSTVHGGQGNIVTNGLVLNLDAANPRSYLPPYNGTTWFDLAGSNNGTLTNGPTYNSANGGSIVFDGTNDYIDLGNNLSLSTSIGFTISVYFKLTSYVISYPTLYTIKTSLGSSLCLLLTNLSNNYSPLTFGWNGNSYKPTTLNTLSTNVWYQLVLVYNGNGVNNSSNFSIYVNNTLYSVSTGGNFSGIGNVNTLGTLNTGTSGFWYTGNIAQTLIYNKALSQTEINQNFQATRARFGI